MLNGLGGDELFGGYRYYSWIKYWKILKNFSFLFPNTFGKLRLFDRANAIVSSKNSIEYALAARAFILKHEFERLFDLPNHEDASLADFYQDLYIPAGMKFLDEIQAVNYIELMTNVGNHHLHRLDAFSMRFGVEARVPFLDHRLVSLALNLSPQNKVNFSSRKVILQKMASKVLPKSVLNAPKRGLSLPMKSWMKSELSNFIQENLNSLGKREIIRKNAIENTLSEWKNGTRSQGEYGSLCHLRFG